MQLFHFIIYILFFKGVKFRLKWSQHSVSFNPKWDFVWTIRLPEGFHRGLIWKLTFQRDQTSVRTIKKVQNIKEY